MFSIVLVRSGEADKYFLIEVSKVSGNTAAKSREAQF